MEFTISPHTTERNSLNSYQLAMQIAFRPPRFHFLPPLFSGWAVNIYLIGYPF